MEFRRSEEKERRMTSQFLSPSEVSSLLRICLKQVYKLLNKGELPGSFKLGGIWMIDRDILMDGLKAKAQRPKPISKPGDRMSRHGLD
ncbi:hypothetical cytosolic protein [Syntrophus aciditrophicus SB]|uniref:Hypothetical cytosolic protein n=2 Tax=Syntrophus TaxID=43773 RepID=Q2LSJ0_SYNAS|nr:hypothetical cytosolic protein [Syntrophus aciditrophicus SB]